MRAFIIPALCAMAVFAGASLSYAAASVQTEDLSTAQTTLDNTTRPIYDTWQDDTTQLPY